RLTRLVDDSAESEWLLVDQTLWQRLWGDAWAINQAVGVDQHVDARLADCNGRAENRHLHSRDAPRLEGVDHTAEIAAGLDGRKFEFRLPGARRFGDAGEAVFPVPRFDGVWHKAESRGTGLKPGEEPGSLPLCDGGNPRAVSDLVPAHPHLL